jgi:hypothetical protein
MEDLKRIKALEAELAAEAERAGNEGKILVQAAKDRGEEELAKARKEAEWEGGRLAAADEADARNRAKETSREAEESVRLLDRSYARNAKAAVELILAELGV